MFDEIGKFLVAQGSIGVLALCGLIATVILWRTLVKLIKAHRDDRDQWLNSLLTVIKENAGNQEKLAGSLESLEKSTEQLYSLYHDLSHGLKK